MTTSTRVHSADLPDWQKYYNFLQGAFAASNAEMPSDWDYDSASGQYESTVNGKVEGDFDRLAPVYAIVVAHFYIEEVGRKEEKIAKYFGYARQYMTDNAKRFKAMSSSDIFEFWQPIFEGIRGKNDSRFRGARKKTFDAMLQAENTHQESEDETEAETDSDSEGYDNEVDLDSLYSPEELQEQERMAKEQRDKAIAKERAAAAKARLRFKRKGPQLEQIKSSIEVYMVHLEKEIVAHNTPFWRSSCCGQRAALEVVEDLKNSTGIDDHNLILFAKYWVMADLLQSIDQAVAALASSESCAVVSEKLRAEQGGLVDTGNNDIVRALADSTHKGLIETKARGNVDAVLGQHRIGFWGQTKGQECLAQIQPILQGLSN